MISTLPTSMTQGDVLFKSYFALIMLLLLLTLLIQKEVASVAEESHWKRLSRVLNILIIPLGLAFLGISAVELSHVFFGV